MALQIRARAHGVTVKLSLCSDKVYVKNEYINQDAFTPPGRNQHLGCQRHGRARVQIVVQLGISDTIILPYTQIFRRACPPRPPRQRPLAPPPSPALLHDVARERTVGGRGRRAKSIILGRGRGARRGRQRPHCETVQGASGHGLRGRA